ncbi:hypothetical protein BDW02DRAFT_633583 [Decorospora gaudefroyi]|uniref:Chromo domain-containing protein n=1 Tax=Decorospora gaudefroyi TaxID=184978 RepID=A0A6A5K7H8_9PLEO|nr:hypothetical protein BDW02DRAFT_633583 [Decorospora gaudefroyi]
MASEKRTSEKRKRNSTRAKPNKRQRYEDSSASASTDESQATDGSKTYYAADCILSERTRRGGRQYLIKWKGTDPDTGSAYENSWEPEEYATAALIAAWEQGKARSGQRQDAPPRRRRVCNSRVVQSSPDSTSRSSSPSPSVPSTTARNRAGSQSSRATTPVEAAPALASTRLSPHIRITRRGDSLDREQYTHFSQLDCPQPESPQPDSPQPASAPPATQATEDSNLDSSQLFAARPPAPSYSSGIVPVSQPSASEASFIPPTQCTAESNQQSTNTTESAEDVTEDSGLLEIIQEAASHPVSPARSIPETIPDTTVADSQSQHRKAELELIRAADTIELVESTWQPAQVPSQGQDEGVPIDHGDEQQAATQVESRQEDNELVTQQVTTPDPQQAASQPAPDAALQGAVHPGQRQQEIASQEPTSAEIGEAQSSVGASESRNWPNASIAIDSVQARPSEPDTPSHTAVGLSEGLASLTEHSEPENAQFAFLSQRPFNSQHQSEFPAEVHVPGAHLPDSGPPPATQSEQGLVGSPAQSTIPKPSHPPCAPQSFAEEREQNAQVIPPLEVDLSTQEDRTESVLPTIEQDYEAPHRASSESRHDSSQETPEKSLRSFNTSSSPIPRPPTYSLDTQGSKLPPWPCTPVPTSSLSIMASEESIGERVERQLKEAMAKQHAENPFIPRRRFVRSSLTPSAAAGTAEGSNSTPTPASRLLRTNQLAEGTRSPSAVPDRSPVAQVPTSLRTVALVPSSVGGAMASVSGPEPEPAEIDETVTAEPPAPTPPAEEPQSSGSDEMELSDVDDEDTESLLNDELQLAPKEFIVPLYIQGRQKEMYSEFITQKKDMLEQFLKDSGSASPLLISEVKNVLKSLRARETHMDLVFAEAGLAIEEEVSDSQAQHAANFGILNSVKFRFLHQLFLLLRDQESEKLEHVVLVTEDGSDALLDIFELFCKAQHVDYNIPTRGRKADRASVQDCRTLLVTIIPADASPIIRPPDLIICVDGVQDASQIRQKNWARSPSSAVMPVIHLVIPRTVGHIERYISPKLDPVAHMHTVLASLAHMHVRQDIGEAIDEDTPRDVECAEKIVEWFLGSTESEEELSWPIPSIGSVKGIIEYQTQLSQTSTNSPAPERTKRRLDDEDLDPAKRMRFTPQPQKLPSSSINEHEITRISDSMPGTAADGSYLKEREDHRATKKHLREQEEIWDRRQTEYEDLTREYRLLLGNKQATDSELEAVKKSKATLAERLTTATTENHELKRQLDEQRATDLLSPDAKLSEITKLRTALATAHSAKASALRAAQSAEATLDYTKEAYQASQSSATSCTARLSDLEATNHKLAHAASGEAAKLKSLHLDKAYELQDEQNKALRVQIANLKRALAVKEDHILALRSARQGVGTRAASATPQPKVRSRAASPSLLGGRIGSLRNA